MASSDDESETLAQSVTNYSFEDDKGVPISFSILPTQCCHDDSVKSAVFLKGIADDGIQKIYKQVTEWKYQLIEHYQQPEISVLSKEKNWIKLLKPRKSYEDIVKSVLVTVNCLHFFKKHSEASGTVVWDKLWKTFSSYEVRPCESDLLGHLSLIRVAVKQDEALSKSEFLMTFLENPMKRKELDEDMYSGSDAKKGKFIVDDDEDLGYMGLDVGDESDEEAELFDSVCSICDNGGELLCCEGRCIRSFHSTVDDGEDSFCESLGYTKSQVKAMQSFLCLNCQHKRHQCFACGELGSSDKSSGTEVFHCVSATCGYFYHPECVAKLLHPMDDAVVEELQKRIFAGESFTCPAHKCHKCKQREDKDILGLQFAVCRRCPKAYHRKCLPRKIAFEDLEEEDITTRAWDGLLPNNRVLIYCLKHEIDETLGTPIRNHITFPRIEEKKKSHPSELQLRKGKAVTERRFSDTEELPKKKPFSEKDFKSTEKPLSRKHLRDGGSSTSVRKEKFSGLDRTRVSSKEGRPNPQLIKGFEPVKSNQKEVTGNKFEGTINGSLAKKPTTTFLVDAETKRRLMAMMEKKASSITLEDVVKRHKVPSTHSYSLKTVVDKNITQGKVEGFTEAVRIALKKLEEGGTVEDAQAVCGPEILNHIIKWKNKLRVYLAPFLHGMRYTSFGRHFTKVDKLKEIVDKLHWYTQSGDMIVDFCCGANDFSWLMKQKLEETGKRCSFINFDVIQPKNDFCFEKRDWMTVRSKELPTGSNLIMGLNPPFGVKAALANKFIDKALEFKPKLLILIVPPETERLDEKKPAYDLVWEDGERLSGKSFYLPGSVDVNDNQIEQWNVIPPHLYLWSHPDWSTKHKAIALKQGHLYKEEKEAHVEENKSELQFSEDMEISPIRVHHEDVSELKNEYADVKRKNSLLEQYYETGSDENMVAVPKIRKHSSPLNHYTGVDQIRPSNDSNRDNQNYQRERSHENQEAQCEGTQSMRIAKIPTDPRNSAEVRSSEVLEIQTDRAGSEYLQRFHPGLCDSGLESKSGYGDMGMDNLDDIARRYSSERLNETTNWSTVKSHDQQYGLRGVDEQFHGYGRPYPNELEENRRESDVQQLLRRYGGINPGSLSPSNCPPGQDTGFGRLGSLSSTAYIAPGLAPDSSSGKVTSSAILRYAPRLDELNHTRMIGFGSQTPLIGGSGLRNNLVSQYAHGSSTGIHPNVSGFVPGSGTGIHPNISGFAPGPPHSFPHQNSSGWLNE